MATKGTQICDRCGKEFAIDLAPGKEDAPPADVIRARVPVVTDDGQGVVARDRDICSSCVKALIEAVKAFWTPGSKKRTKA